MLFSEATNYDVHHSSPSGQSSRKVYVNEADNSNSFRDSVSEVTKENIDYEIDASASTLKLA